MNGHHRNKESHFNFYRATSGAPRFRNVVFITIFKSNYESCPSSDANISFAG